MPQQAESGDVEARIIAVTLVRYLRNTRPVIQQMRYTASLLDGQHREQWERAARMVEDAVEMRETIETTMTAPCAPREALNQ